MNIAEEIISVKIICPHCKGNFIKDVKYRKKRGLYTVLIKDHPNSEGCPPFIVFIDNNGKHRGSQKIDKFEEEVEFSIEERLIEGTGRKINELKEALRFYHIKMPRKEGGGFEHKIASVLDRAFMSSKLYLNLIDFLTENEENNAFCVMDVPQDSEFEGGLLVYGKYLGMIFTLFWRNQKSLHYKKLEGLKAYTKLTLEQLIELYDLGTLKIPPWELQRNLAYWTILSDKEM